MKPDQSRKKKFTIALAAFLFTACLGRGQPNDQGKGDHGSFQDKPAPGSSAQQKPSTAASSGTTKTRNGPGESQNASINPGPGTIDNRSVGTANRAILGDASPYTKIVLEIDYVDSVKPNSSLINDLKDMLQQQTGKPVTLEGGNAIESLDRDWQDSDVERLADRRTLESSAPKAVIWLAFLDNHSANDGQRLGVAFRSTSFVMYPEYIQEVVPEARINPGPYNKAILFHEMGHILGLVNIGYHSSRPHEDSAHPGHSKNNQSVMYWAVEQVSIADVFRGGPPTHYDADDLADLKDLREGRL